MRFVPVMTLAVSLSACMPQRSNSEDAGAMDPNTWVAPLGCQWIEAVGEAARASSDEHRITSTVRFVRSGPGGDIH